MVVVGPAEAEPVLARLLHGGGVVARLPVLALGLEDEVAGQVGRTGQLDDPLQGRLGGRHAFLVVVEAPPTPPPEVQCRQGISGGLRLHPAVSRQIARERLEAQITPALDHRQRRPLARNPADSIGTHRIADDLQPQVVGARERRDRVDLDRDLLDLEENSVRTGRGPDGRDDPRKNPAGMPEDRHSDRVMDRLALVAEGLQPLGQAGAARDLHVIHPRREPRPGLGRHPLGELCARALPSSAAAIIKSMNASVSGHRCQLNVD